MVQFEYNKVMKRHDVKLPFTLADESDMVMVASITEENKVVLHRDLSINLLRQILMHWDEYEYQMERESDELSK
jgi:ribosomal protein L25 (general stress protein Ctc)